MSKSSKVGMSAREFGAQSFRSAYAEAKATLDVFEARPDSDLAPGWYWQSGGISQLHGPFGSEAAARGNAAVHQ